MARPTIVRVALLGMVIVFALLALPRPARAADGVVERVAAATEAFRNATVLEGTEERSLSYRRAAELYDAALDVGPQNGALEYNAGNAWFLAGDPGRAILHYRRALLVRPGDARVLANLDTARSRRRDRFEETSTRALTETLFFWHSGLSLGTKIPLALAAWALGFGLLALHAWLRPHRVGRPDLGRAGALLLVVALAIGISATVEMSARATRDAAVIVADEIALRTGDGTSYPERYENPVHAGAEVRLIEVRAGWVDIELPDGKRGWIPAESAERI